MENASALTYHMVWGIFYYDLKLRRYSPADGGRMRIPGPLRRNELDGTHGMRRLDRLGFEKRALREGRATV